MDGDCCCTRNQLRYFSVIFILCQPVTSPGQGEVTKSLCETGAVLCEAFTGSMFRVRGQYCPKEMDELLPRKARAAPLSTGCRQGASRRRNPVLLSLQAVACPAAYPPFKRRAIWPRPFGILHISQRLKVIFRKDVFQNKIRNGQKKVGVLLERLST